MSNTLTNLIPVMWKGMDLARRELVGLIPSVDMDASAALAAVNQTVRTPIIPVATTGNITPGQLPPNDGDQTIGYLDMAVTKAKYSPIRWAGEEVMGYKPNGQFEMTPCPSVCRVRPRPDQRSRGRPGRAVHQRFP